jgi:Putative transposase
LPELRRPAAASLHGRPLPSRRARRVKRTQVLGGREHALPARTASCDGYNLNAGTYVPARDRGGLERLARYVLRPPLAKARLEQRADGTVVLGLKRAWSDGTTALELSASELVEKRVAILPPPRANQVIYRGVLAANAKLRRKVVPKPREARPERKRVQEAAPRPRPDRAAWSSLLHRVFGVDGFACPTCRGPMVLRTVVVGPVSGKILGDLVRSSGALHATGPP